MTTSSTTSAASYHHGVYPDARGRYGDFGGRFVPESLMAALAELEQAYDAARADAGFAATLANLERTFTGRPTPLYFASRLSERVGARVYLKREDLAHTGAHKINNALGQGLLAERMGKRRIIAETGAGQHGVATATVCARQGLECVVYMGEEDIQPPVAQRLSHEAARRRGAPGQRGQPDAQRRHQRGAARLGDQRRDDPLSHRLRCRAASLPAYRARLPVGDWSRDARSRCSPTLGGCPMSWSPASAAAATPSACSIPSRAMQSVRLVGVEAGGRGIASGQHAATLVGGRPGVLHGALSYLLQDEHGQVIETHSISAGLDYPGVGPEHSYLKATGRASYVAADDDAALRAFQILSEDEGIIPALESSHAVAWVLEQGERGAFTADTTVVINLSGRGDKDINTVADALGVTL